MATVTLTFPPGDLQRTVDALSARFGYQALMVDGSPNPQPAGEFVRHQVIKWIMQQVREHELNTARAAIAVTDIVIT